MLHRRYCSCLFAPPIFQTEEMDEGQEGTYFLIEISVSRENRAYYQQKIPNHDEAED